MLKIIPIILLLSIFGGCAYTNLNYTHKDKGFTGVWEASNNSRAILKIYPRQRQTYLLHFKSDEASWEGVGYEYDGKMIAIFRYKNVNEQGFITFTLERPNKLNYISMNPDGSIRYIDYYIRH